MEPTTFNESVAAAIRAELGRQWVTQQELAKRLGWAPSQLSKRLRGIIPFSTDEIDFIAETLGIPRHELASPRQAAS